MTNFIGRKGNIGFFVTHNRKVRKNRLKKLEMAQKTQKKQTQNPVASAWSMCGGGRWPDFGFWLAGGWAF